MNRINELFVRKSENILSVYYTAGYPELDSTIKVAQKLEQAGADMIEIGIPYSDPLADGPTIQASGQQALKNGMTLKLLFEQLKTLRNEVSIPVLLMGYLNPVMQFGVEKFCAEAARVGVDGFILPDLPIYEYETEYTTVFKQYGLKNIFLITPQTTDERIRKIDALSDGFIYMVSSASTTGAKSEISDKQMEYFERINKMQMKNPALIGFGISSGKTFSQACQFASGAIVGSAFIKLLNNDNYIELIEGFVNELKGGI